MEPYGPWLQEDTAAVCRDLDCGSAVYGEQRKDFPQSPVWRVSPDCVEKSAVRHCVYDSSSSSSSSWGLEVKCSDSVRLVSGPSLCSGSVQIWDQSWTWVCEGALDQQGAEVLCRELGCGAPSLLQGALSPLEQTFHCEGHESALMDCPRSGSETCSSGAAVNLTCSEPLRLVGGASRCAGTVEVRHRGEWRQMEIYTIYGPWVLEDTAVVCRDLDCGSAVYGEKRKDFPQSPMWGVSSDCVKKSAVRDCVYGLSSSSSGLEVKCSDSVRLVSGPSLCSGSVQIWDQSWTWVCEGALDQQGAEVLCRELGCGAPSLLQGALSPLEQTFHCEGHESALMDCPRSGSETCSSGAAVNLTCSEPLRLVGGASRCAGTVEMRHRGEWRRMRPFEYNRDWLLEHTAAVCRDLDCGSAVYGEKREDFPQSPVWRVSPDCVEKSAVRDCVYDSSSSSSGLEVKCSDSVRLVSGPSLCSGSVQIWDQSWTWVCEGALDQQGAEVLCRELGCGAPSLLQGALSPLEQTFHCEGHESALMDCPRSGSETCSSGATVNLTCSEPLRLVGGASRCAGTVEVRHRGEWRRMEPNGPWLQEDTAAVCRDLDCGSAVYGEQRKDFPQSPVWRVSPDCVEKSAVRHCVYDSSSSSSSSWGLEVKCSDSVRLVSGPSLCSGSVQIWDQSWTWVCEGALDQQGAEVLCRELGCGAPSLLQGALSPLEQTFHCEGHESALMDCPRSGSETCSSGAAVNLTCSEPLRLVGGASRCAGTVEVRHRGEWRQMEIYTIYGPWVLEDTAVVCRDLDCGSAVYGEKRKDFPQSPMWGVSSDCVKKSAVRDCVYGLSSSSSGLEVKCSDLLNRPVISLSVSDGVSEALPQGVRVLLGSKFRVKCSVEPQYPGGSFQLLSPTAPLGQNHTLPAVNHSAHFLFSDTGPAHKGNYTCVYHLHVFNHNLSSQSPSLQLSLGASDSALIIRVLLILLLKLLYILPMLYYYCKVRARGGARERISLDLDQFRST
ncbi:scavenger receptor cysteine-rich type 1 protein M160-like [Periophthalmus magnuspinnatus]|uniref:scavenger receptor cysteine-rich type 1 protein M160-like n=1 Tax=Periophthalmus magnuspinnatus TaxID=409849 RepID=UPI0024373872|nr:scavenger receptor cysteine-rich type 1 protein M160-like [Periophthalmus magnuspinnatus]